MVTENSVSPLSAMYILDTLNKVPIFINSLLYFEDFDSCSSCSKSAILKRSVCPDEKFGKTTSVKTANINVTSISRIFWHQIKFPSILTILSFFFGKIGKIRETNRWQNNKATITSISQFF